MTDPVVELKTEVAKAEAWFGSNWYPFAIGWGCGVATALVGHWLKLV